MHKLIAAGLMAMTLAGCGQEMNQVHTSPQTPEQKFLARLHADPDPWVSLQDGSVIDDAGLIQRGHSVCDETRKDPGFPAATGGGAAMLYAGHPVIIRQVSEMINAGLEFFCPELEPKR